MSISFVHAEVTLDVSFGRLDSLTPPHYAITDSLGKQIGGNLFHSFDKFNIDTVESATFSGPSSVNNILSRVTGKLTGSSVTHINGLIRSTVPGANLYLLNPAGIISVQAPS